VNALPYRIPAPVPRPPKLKFRFNRYARRRTIHLLCAPFATSLTQLFIAWVDIEHWRGHCIAGGVGVALVFAVFIAFWRNNLEPIPARI
jgi:hypothetical protein